MLQGDLVVAIRWEGASDPLIQFADGRLNTSGFCDTPRQETWTIWTCQFLDQVGVR